MKRLAIALALMCALSTSIFAGNMPGDGRDDMPQPTSSTLLVNVVLTIIGSIGR